jgi:putative transposase
LPKLGWVAYRNSRLVEGDIANVTISRSCDKWYLSIQTEREVAEVIHSSTSAIGVDMGVARLVTLSDGATFESNHHQLNHYQKRIAVYQRRASKKTKFSRNWKKILNKVNKLHQKVSHIRNDYLHQTSDILSKNHAMICLEDLQIKNMSKSASGTLENPGKNVKAKSGLNKAILNQGWYELRRQLEYKKLWRGGMVVLVSPRNTSRTCPDCGYISSENRVTQALFICKRCRYENNADIVGAINILRAGHAQLACGEMVHVGHSMNQEPTEVAQTALV